MATSCLAPAHAPTRSSSNSTQPNCGYLRWYSRWPAKHKERKAAIQRRAPILTVISHLADGTRRHLKASQPHRFFPYIRLSDPNGSRTAFHSRGLIPFLLIGRLERPSNRLSLKGAHPIPWLLDPNDLRVLCSIIFISRTPQLGPAAAPSLGDGVAGALRALELLGLSGDWLTLALGLAGGPYGPPGALDASGDWLAGDPYGSAGALETSGDRLLVVARIFALNVSALIGPPSGPHRHPHRHDLEIVRERLL